MIQKRKNKDGDHWQDKRKDSKNDQKAWREEREPEQA